MENTIKLVSGFAGPIVNQLSPLAASPLAKVDDLATKGLDTLERTVPAIKKQPNEVTIFILYLQYKIELSLVTYIYYMYDVFK